MKDKKFSMPKFLKPDFSCFDFKFLNEKNVSKNETFKQELLLVYGKKNTLILLDDKVIYSNLPKEIEIDKSRLHRSILDYKKKQTTDFLLKENKERLNSNLMLVAKNKAKKHKINIIFGVTKEIYHFFYVDVEKESNLEIFKKIIGRDNAKLNYVLNVDAKENSHLDFACFYDISSENSQVFTQNLQTYKDASINFEFLNLSKANCLNLSYGNLLGQGSNLKVSSCSFADGITVLKNLILLNHKAKNTYSKIENIAVVNENAKIEIDGVGKIDQSFSGSDAQQKSKIISLKDTAQIVVNPQLVINEFDVKAGHSAGVGTLDKNQIYYLQSRGLTFHKAKELLLLALSEKFLANYSSFQKQEAVSLIRKRIR